MRYLHHLRPSSDEARSSWPARRGRSPRSPRTSASASPVCALDAQDDVDTDRKKGLSTTEREALTRLRRDNRRLEMEVEILKRASTYFARENVLPNGVLAQELAADGSEVALQPRNQVETAGGVAQTRVMIAPTVRHAIRIRSVIALFEH